MFEEGIDEDHGDWCRSLLRHCWATTRVDGIFFVDFQYAEGSLKELPA